MNWYYAIGGQQQGPIDEAQLDALVRSGQITSETLVWREGMPNWQPLRQARPTAAPSPEAMPSGAVPPAAAATGTSVPPNEVVCVECGKTFTRENAIQYGTTWVCATCKPIFLQRLREGAPLASPAGSFVSEQDLLNREYRIDIGDCIERGWKLYMNNAGAIIGTSIVMAIVAAGCWIVTSVLGFVIPFANILLSFAYTGPLAGGYFWFLLRLARGEPAGIGDAFAGFSRNFGQLVLASLVQGVINLLCMLPMILIGATAGFISSGGRGASPQLSVGIAIGMAVTGMVGFVVLMYLAILWVHSIILIIDKGYSFWPAMQLSRKLVSKRWWMTFLFMFVGGIISSAGFLACIIGLLLTVPLYFAMRMYLYEDNFRDLAPQSQL